MIEQLNELQLSNDLTTIETEIKSYQNIAGQSIFEIGRRLKHVKENDLAHGEFGKWLEKVGLDKYQASRFIKVADEQPKLRPSANLGLKALYQNEMTNKEREEFKRQIKQRDEQNAQLQSQVEQAHLTTKTLFHMWLNSMYTRTVVLYLHNMISTINNSITKACTGTIYHNIKLSVIVILIVFSYVTIIFSFSVWFS